jgi:3-oxoadipate CoA-transferase beta subunit
LTKTGDSKLTTSCTYPLTGLGCVSRVYTDLAVIDLSAQGATVIEIVDGVSFKNLQGVTAVPLIDGR